MTAQQLVPTNSRFSHSSRTRILSVLLFLVIAPVLLFERVGLSQEAAQRAKETPPQTAPTGVVSQSKEPRTAKQAKAPVVPKGSVPAATAMEQLPKADQASPQHQEKGILAWIEGLQSHRVLLGTISILFTAFPLAAAVLYLMFALHRGPTDIKDRLYPFFGEGRLGEMIVIILIAGNVCSLAIMGILEQGPVASIYSGIVGYVLGKATAGGKPPGTGG